MNGAVIPNTPIAVDFWRVRQCPHSRIFFLSHMHGDHTSGLTSSWHSHTIYCSEVTRKLVIAKLRVKSELVVGLPLDEPVTINLDEIGEETMTVTLVDANHCPGSVMFLFEGYFGKILYTGDFRFCQRFVTHAAIKGKQFDILYLDNTYCHPKCDFPSRSCATIIIMEIIRNHPNHKIVIGLHSLGKEILLHSIAISCQTWIGVDPSRRETLELLGMPHVFSSDVDRARVRVVNSQEVTKRNIQFWNLKEPTIAILPTCLFVGGNNPYGNVPNIFVVPYSDHSSFTELQKFVEVVRPRKLIPIVHKHRVSPDEPFNSRVNMNVFQHLMDSSPSLPYSIPHSVECFMATEIRQASKKRAKVTRKLCMKKVPKLKKPCGVVFPPTQEAATDGDPKEKLKIVAEFSDNINQGMAMKISIEATDSNSGAKETSDDGTDVDITAKTTDKERTDISSKKQESELRGKVKMSVDGSGRDVDMTHKSKGEESGVVLSSFKDAIDSRKIKKEGNQHMHNTDVNMEDQANDNESVIASFSVKQNINSGRRGREDDRVDEQVDVTKAMGEEGKVAASSKQETNSGGQFHVTVDSCRDENSPGIKEDTSDKQVTSTAANVKGDQSGINLKGSNSVKRQDVLVRDCQDRSGTGADERQAKKRKKFNIYTGCTCDFARNVLEDMVKNGACHF